VLSEYKQFVIVVDKAFAAEILAPFGILWRVFALIFKRIRIPKIVGIIRYLGEGLM